MSTLPPPFVNEFPPESLEKQVYSLVENLAYYIPVANDRNRLAYNLFKFLTVEGDSPIVSIKNSKINIQGISVEELALKIEDGIHAIKK